MHEKIELLDHHRDVIEQIETIMREPYTRRDLSRLYEKGETLTVEEAVEEYTIIWEGDDFYHLQDPVVRENSVKALTQAVKARLDGRVVYRSDDTAVGDIICDGCFWNNKDDANPEDCPIAYYKNQIGTSYG
jgi:hypothetical protein